MVEVLDGATLEPLSTFKTLGATFRLGFSPDGRFLVGFRTPSQFTNWNLQTSGRIGAAYFEPHERDQQRRVSSTHSVDGGAAAYKVGSKFRPTETWFISTYNLITGTHAYSHEISEGCIAPPIWTRGDHFRFVTVRQGSITRGRVLTVTNDICRSGVFVFHPALSRLGFDLEGTVLVWDAPNTRFLLNFVCGDSPAEISFSSDGRFSARQDAKEDICIWRDSPTDYILHQTLVPHVDQFLRPHLSTNGECITLHDHSTIRLWPTESPTL